MITVDCIGHGYTAQKFLRAAAAAQAAVPAGIGTALLLVERRAKLIATEKHIIDTGALRARIFSKVTGPASGTVTSAVDYAIYIEYGHHTRGGGSWVEARPYMRPALDESKREITHAIGHPVVTAVKASILA